MIRRLIVTTTVAILCVLSFKLAPLTVTLPTAGGNGTMPIGQHTINALVQMGVDPAALSSHQLEVRRDFAPISYFWLPDI